MSSLGYSWGVSRIVFGGNNLFSSGPCRGVNGGEECNKEERSIANGK